ncbi:hypothetical protein H6781_00180 [Candidatus Nomurabacteria bacterium]|nr:hypothetical protein [Candidatus Nomurabacteria bacterium]
MIVAGAHTQIIQSILDFDYIRGADVPSITAIVGGTKKSHKCWFGDREILLPVYKNFELSSQAGVRADWLLNIASGNSARKMTKSFFCNYPDATGAHIFAENVSEQDALSLVRDYGDTKLIAGASGVGLLLPGVMKLGAIGGILGGNISHLARHTGNTAVICSSGGMVNEIVDTVVRAGGTPSFAVSYGGERFPVTSPVSWFLEAEDDSNTEQILFFGELGGHDEYDIALAIKNGKITKPVYAYIAGHYNSGDKNIQFGHAKALAKNPDEGVEAKMEILDRVGVRVASNFESFVKDINHISHKSEVVTKARLWRAPDTFRRNSLFTAVEDRGKGKDKFIHHSLCTLLEKSDVSDVFINFTELAYSLLVDHGAEVSGAVNTMITARAGKDMSSSLASGVLTVGDRFGGAINAAAKNWYNSVNSNLTVEEMLEEHKSRGEYVMGIGHLKYSVYDKDPRVEKLIRFARENLKKSIYLDYAEAVERRTTQKKPNLILNVDGAVAAIVTDILVEQEDFSEEQIEDLLRIEFYNSYFLIPRAVGFIGNYLTQKRRDEGLFRLDSEQIFYE